MVSIELVGYLAIVLIASSLVPQVIKSWKTKSTKDISLFWNSLYVLGLICWLTYGIGIKNTPLIVSSVIEGTLAASLLILKIKYG